MTWTDMEENNVDWREFYAYITNILNELDFSSNIM